MLRFREEFGDAITVGSASMKEFKKIHVFVPFLDKAEDSLIRDHYYYGGRVQCFQSGIIKGPFNVYDVNSMYPYVMSQFEHPISRPEISASKRITEDTCFISAEGYNNNAFPFRDENGSLRFNKEYGIFHVSIHEWKVAERYGLFKPTRILQVVNFKHRRKFYKFVSHFYESRKQANLDGDATLALFYKYILNSCSGKFSQDSSQYFDYNITDLNTWLQNDECENCRLEECTEHWMHDETLLDHGIHIWKRRNPKPVYYNVATGSSITGAARAVLLEAIANADCPLYCDTDSLICKSIDNVNFSDTDLGAWKCEGSGKLAAIAGKKMYALFDKSRNLVEDSCIKMASKGVNLTAMQIFSLCQNPGSEINYQKLSPTFHIDGSYSFLSRKARMTAK